MEINFIDHAKVVNTFRDLLSSFERSLIGYKSKLKYRLSISILLLISQPYAEQVTILRNLVSSFGKSLDIYIGPVKQIFDCKIVFIFLPINLNMCCCCLKRNDSLSRFF